MSRSARRRWVTSHAMSRSRRAWWVPPGPDVGVGGPDSLGGGPHRLQAGVRLIDVRLLFGDLGIGRRAVGIWSGKSLPWSVGTKLWIGQSSWSPVPRSVRSVAGPWRPTRCTSRRTQDANRLLAAEPFAVLLGMLLDQQVPMEWAFQAPALLKERLGGTLDPAAIAAMEPAALEEVFRAKPALHRYPGSMAKRTHALAPSSSSTTTGAPSASGTTRRPARAVRAAARAPRFRQRQGADLRRAARQAPRCPAAGLGGGGRRLAVDRRRRHLRTRARDPREEEGAQGRAEVGQGDPEIRDHAVFFVVTLIDLVVVPSAAVATSL